MSFDWKQRRIVKESEEWSFAVTGGVLLRDMLTNFAVILKGWEETT